MITHANNTQVTSVGVLAVQFQDPKKKHRTLICTCVGRDAKKRPHDDSFFTAASTVKFHSKNSLRKYIFDTVGFIKVVIKTTTVELPLAVHFWVKCIKPGGKI